MTTPSSRFPSDCLKTFNAGMPGWGAKPEVSTKGDGVTQSLSLADAAYAWGGPIAVATLKQTPADFVVTELLQASLTGKGEHLWCWVEKKGHNTDAVVKQLAKRWRKPIQAFGYAGKKDRQATTYQWISVHDPKHHLSCPPQRLNLPGVRLLDCQRHRSKCRRGQLQGNHFALCLRDIRQRGVSAAETQKAVDARLHTLARRGVPNYFGPQRFGHGEQNLQAASDWFQASMRSKRSQNRVSKNQQGLYLSAVRAAMFNQLLSWRIDHQAWWSPWPGDVWWTPETGHHQTWWPADPSPSIEAPVSGGWSGLLPGRGRWHTLGWPLAWERSVVSAHPLWMQGLEQKGVQASRRCLRVQPRSMTWQWADATTLHCQFSLPAGSYATAVLREVFILNTAVPGQSADR